MLPAIGAQSPPPELPPANGPVEPTEAENVWQWEPKVETATLTLDPHPAVLIAWRGRAQAA